MASVFQLARIPGQDRTAPLPGSHRTLDPPCTLLRTLRPMARPATRPARLAPAAHPGFCRTRPTPGSPHPRLASTPTWIAPHFRSTPRSRLAPHPFPMVRLPGSHAPAPFFASNGQKRAGLAICRVDRTLRFGLLVEKSLVAFPPNSAKRFDDCQTGSFLTFEGLFGVRGEASAGFPGAFHAGRAASHARKAARCANAPRAASAGSARCGRAR